MFAKINAPYQGLLFRAGRPKRVLPAGFHFILPVVDSVRKVNCSLRTEEAEVDVITRGGTPTQIKVGYTARITDVEKALLNLQKPFATLRASVISVVSGAANNYSIDELAQKKSMIAQESQQELLQLAESNQWGMGDFQIAIGDPSMSEELKKLLMREEAVKRENAANLERANNQLEVAKKLKEVALTLAENPFGQDLLRMQMLTDMGEGGKVIVVDSRSLGGASGGLLAEGLHSRRGG